MTKNDQTFSRNPPSEYAGAPYASFLLRALGSLADGSILSLVSTLVRSALILWLAAETDLVEELALASIGQNSIPVGRIVLVVFVWLAMSFVFNVAYFALQEGSRQAATVGKRLVRVKVVDATTRTSVGPGRAAVRTSAKILSLLPLGLGYLWMLWDPKRQCWHDKLSHTVVIVTRP